uniref:Uncharacterized protein n=1 Tax=Anguilla anguilla TaxID=7936 RepID=A0A0E9XNC9_ANGAN
MNVKTHQSIVWLPSVTLGFPTSAQAHQLTFIGYPFIDF